MKERNVLTLKSRPLFKNGFNGLKSVLNASVVYSTDRSKAVVPVVYSTGRLVLCLTLCYFVLVCFSPFSIAITSLGEDRANLSAFRTFVWIALVWFCLFPLPLGAWEGLRFVIVALPGIFSYLFWYAGIETCSHKKYASLQSGRHITKCIVPLNCISSERYMQRSTMSIASVIELDPLMQSGHVYLICLDWSISNRGRVSLDLIITVFYHNSCITSSSVITDSDQS